MGEGRQKTYETYMEEYMKETFLTTDERQSDGFCEAIPTKDSK